MRRNFDIPKSHAVEPQYKIPKALTALEIGRWATLPSLVINTEMHSRGLNIIKHVLDCTSIASPDFNFAASTFAATGLNTAWDISAKGSEVMRRRIQLPDMYDSVYSDQVLDVELYDEAKTGFGVSAISAMTYRNKLLAPKSLTDLEKSKLVLGQRVGESALKLICATIPYRGAPTTVQELIDLQQEAFENSVCALDTAKLLASQLGSVPTCAQLSSDFSPLTSYIMENAPTENFYRAMDNALGLYGMPR